MGHSQTPNSKINNKYTFHTNGMHIYSISEVYFGIELELELIQTQMTQKPMLRVEVYARALRASQNRKEDSL